MDLKITTQNDPHFGGLCFMVHTRRAAGNVRFGGWVAVSMGFERYGSDWTRRICTSSLMEAVEVLERFKNAGYFNTDFIW